MTPEELDEYDRIGYMTFSEREAKALIAEVRRLHGAVAAERERCAKVAEGPFEGSTFIVRGVARMIADKIREGK